MQRVLSVIVLLLVANCGGNSATHFVVIIDSPATAGSNIAITVSAVDRFGQTATDYDGGGIIVTCTDPLFVNNSPLGLTLGTGTKNGFVLKTAGTQVVYVTNGTTNGQVNVAVVPGPMSSLAITWPATAVVGQPISISVSAQDLFGNIVLSYTGTVHFSSTATGANLPVDMVLVNGISGPLLVTFSAPDTPTITVQDTSNPSFSATTDPILVQSVPATHLSLVATSPVTAGTNFNLIVNAVDDLGATDTAITGAVLFTCSDTAFVNVGPIVLKAGTVTGSGFALKTVGTQTITANSDNLGGQIDVVVIPGPTTSFAITVPASATVGVATVVSAIALDEFGNVATSYTGTTHFSSSDVSASLPADMIFVNGVSGSIPITFNSPGTQTVSIEDTADPRLSAISESVTVAKGATGGGDPAFVGFTGKRFHFHGKPHKYFHIYSDPYLTVNSHFAIANPKRGKGTVMDAFVIRWENHSIAFDVQSRMQNDTMLRLFLDDSELLLRKGKEAMLDVCISAMFNSQKLYVRTPLHSICIDWKIERTNHINGWYFNILVNAPLAEKGLRFGGILGQTAYIDTAISMRIEDFAVPDNSKGEEARTSVFEARALLCTAVVTQRPVTAMVVHKEH